MCYALFSLIVHYFCLFIAGRRERGGHEDGRGPKSVREQTLRPGAHPRPGGVARDHLQPPGGRQG